MGEWHSTALYLLYQVLGWFAFVAWSISFYPQVLLNYRRKSVVGLNFDFALLNFTKHSSYLIYNAGVFFSKAVQRQYHEQHGFDELIPVAANDVAFSIHAVLLTLVTIIQIFLYEKGGQRLSKTCAFIAASAWLAGLVCLFIAAPKGDWLWFVKAVNVIQLIMTGIKYIPQAYMNFRRGSTDGWSIGNILLDLSGGIGNILQMLVQSVDQHSLVNFAGNVGKVGLSLETIAFDMLFVVQHYVLYPKTVDSEDSEPDIEKSLLQPTDKTDTIGHSGPEAAGESERPNTKP